MIIIVVYHSMLFLGGEWFNDVVQVPSYKTFQILCNWLNSFHIYAFVLISGYVFYYIKYEKNGYEHFFPFFVNKVKRLIVPYVFVLFFWVIPFYIFFYGFDIQIIAVRFFLGTAPNQIWFLLALFLTFMISFFLSSVFKEKVFMSLLIVLAMVAAGTLGGHFFPNFFQIWSSLRFVAFFFLGFKIRQCWSSYIKKCPFFIWILVDVSLFAFCCFLQTTESIVCSYLNVALMFLVNAVGSIMAWQTLDFVANRVNTSSKIQNFLSKRTMIVFLFHQQIIYVSIYLFASKMNEFLVLILNIILSFSISLIIASIMLLWNWTRFLVGEKPKKSIKPKP